MISGRILCILMFASFFEISCLSTTVGDTKHSGILGKNFLFLRMETAFPKYNSFAENCVLPKCKSMHWLHNECNTKRNK